MLIGFLPLVFIGGLIFFFLRRGGIPGNQGLAFGKSGARAFSADDPTITFDEVAGVDEAKSELQEVVEFLKEPKKFQRIGGKVSFFGCGETYV